MNINLISFIIPTLNRKNDLLRLLDSIKKASAYYYVVWEAIIVDQSNKLNIEDFQKYSEVKIISSKIMGLSINRNRGVQQSIGDLLIFIDDDCVVQNDYFEQLIGGIKKYPDSNVFCGRLLELETNNPFLPLFAINNDKIIGQNDFGYFMGSTHLIKKSLWIKYLLKYQEDLGAGTKNNAGEETFLFFDLLSKDEKVIYLGKMVYKHPAQQSLPWRKRLGYSKGNGVVFTRIFFEIKPNLREFWFPFILPLLKSFPNTLITLFFLVTRLNLLIRFIISKNSKLTYTAINKLQKPPSEYFYYFIGNVIGILSETKAQIFRKRAKNGK